jgi:hypothetical protein
MSLKPRLKLSELVKELPVLPNMQCCDWSCRLWVAISSATAYTEPHLYWEVHGCAFADAFVVHVAAGNLQAAAMAHAVLTADLLYS